MGLFSKSNDPHQRGLLNRLANPNADRNGGLIDRITNPNPNPNGGLLDKLFSGFGRKSAPQNPNDNVPPPPPTNNNGQTW
ncbi:MAG TPA: hypothetical protein VH186_15445 [Chloroflexia bacterium]|nr:hypothetical protein [Chloroflexia bacterium]